MEPFTEFADLREQARDALDGMVALRRTLHEWPELGNDLPVTRENVLGALDGLPLAITQHRTTSGIAALLDGGKPGPTVLLRADMDALPLHEDSGEECSSRIDGQMHACGHDTHTAMLVGAARMLSDRRSEIPGRVLFMFQPGEEGFGGAEFMLDEGLLDVPARADGSESPVTGAYALHITSFLPSGWIASKGGSIMASADTVQIVVTGRGGHASAPHHALDPIPIACEIVQSLQTMVTRTIDVFDPAVVTVGRITAGTTNNVIPETATIEATIRAISEGTRAKVRDGIRRVAEGIATAHDAGVSVDFADGYPVTVNDRMAADFAIDLAGEVIGTDKVVRMPNPVMGAEDFSYVLNRLPGAMLFLGGTHEGRNPATAPANHSNRVLFDEAAMVNGASLYSAMALRHLTGSPS
jgi:amidohydrolase